jgi:hypothetical protein
MAVEINKMDFFIKGENKSREIKLDIESQTWRLIKDNINSIIDKEVMISLY